MTDMVIRTPTNDEGAALRHFFEDGLSGLVRADQYTDQQYGEIISGKDVGNNTVRVNTVDGLDVAICRMTFNPMLAERPPLPFSEGELVNEVSHMYPEGMGVGLLRPLLLATMKAHAGAFPADLDHPLFGALLSGHDPVGPLASTGIEKAQAWKRAMGYRELQVLSGPTGSVGYILVPHFGRFLDFLGV